MSRACSIPALSVVVVFACSAENSAKDWDKICEWLFNVQ